MTSVISRWLLRCKHQSRITVFIIRRLSAFAKRDVRSQKHRGHWTLFTWSLKEMRRILRRWVLAGCPEFSVISLYLLCVDLTVCTLWSDEGSVSSVFMVTRLVTGQLI